jgi:hypothetical protein
MPIIENVLNSKLFYATYRYNIYINIIYCDYYKVTFETKGRVWARNHRDLVDIREKIEVTLEKHNDYNREYLYNIIEISQEEGLACMTNPKITSRHYHAVLKCVYNDKVFDVIFLKEGRLYLKSLKQLSLNCHYGKGLYHLIIYYWWSHPDHNRIIIS